jgi:hypothetical protein
MLKQMIGGFLALSMSLLFLIGRALLDATRDEQHARRALARARLRRKKAQKTSAGAVGFMAAAWSILALVSVWLYTSRRKKAAQEQTRRSREYATLEEMREGAFLDAEEEVLEPANGSQP